MIANLLASLNVFFIASALAFFYNKKIEISMIWAVLSIIILLYLFALTEELMIGWWLVVGLGIACSIYVAANFSKNKLKLILTPGLTFITVFFVISMAISHNRFVTSFDEFNHWFNAVKNTYLLDTLFTNEQSNLLSKSYSPGATLFHYFWSRFDLTYHESYSFISMNFFLSVLLAPVFAWHDWNKKIKHLVLFSLILFLIPLAIYKNIYTGIYVDGLMGFVIAYILFNYFVNKLNQEGFFSIVLALFVLPMVKISGILPALIISIIISIDYLKNGSSDKRIGNE